MEFIKIYQNWKTHESYYLVDKQGKAMIKILYDKEKNSFEIYNLYVDKEYRGKGIGKIILHQAIDLCKELSSHGTILIGTNDCTDKFVDSWYVREGFKFKSFHSDLERENSFTTYIMNF